MKKIVLNSIFAIFAIASFNSCTKKDDSPTTIENDLLNIPKIKTMTVVDQSGTNPSTETFQYDDKGRVIRVDDTQNGISDGTTTLEYPNSTTVTEKWVSSPGSTPETTIITLNDKGQSVIEQRTGVDPYTDTLTYDINGFMTSGDVIVVENGNVIKRGTETFEFYLDKTNTIGYINMGIGFYGKDDKNLVKNDISGTSINTTTYEFDSKSRVSKKTETWNGLKGGDYQATSYTYTD